MAIDNRLGLRYHINNYLIVYISEANILSELEKEPIIAEEADCPCAEVHADKISTVKGGLSPDGLLQNTAEMFKALCDPTRLKIINALMLSELCGCDLAALLKMSQPAISHHLKVLRQLMLVKYRRDGKSVYYELDDEHVRNIFYQGLLHASEQKSGGEHHHA